MERNENYNENFDPERIPTVSMKEMEERDEREMDITTREVQEVDMSEVEDTVGTITEIIKKFVDKHPDADQFSIQLMYNSKNSKEDKQSSECTEDVREVTDQTIEQYSAPTESVEDMLRRVSVQLQNLQNDLRAIKDQVTPVEMPFPELKSTAPLRVNLTTYERGAILNEIKRQRKIIIKEIKKYLKKHYSTSNLFRP